jgi:hypothetical protein
LAYCAHTLLVQILSLAATRCQVKETASRDRGGIAPIPIGLVLTLIQDRASRFEDSKQSNEEGQIASVKKFLV